MFLGRRESHSPIKGLNAVGEGEPAHIAQPMASAHAAFAGPAHRFHPDFSLVIYTHIEDLQDRRESRIKSLQTVDETIAASIDGFARDLETFATSAAITVSTAVNAGVKPDEAAFGSYFSQLAASYNVRTIFITTSTARRSPVLTATSASNALVVPT